MSSSIANRVSSDEVNSLDSIRLKPAKATLPVNGSQCDWRELIAQTIRAVSSQKAAASDMQIDPAQLTRQLQNGHLTVERIEALGPEFAVKLGERLIEEFRPLTDPKTEVRRALEELDRAYERAAEVVRQFIEHAA